MKAILYLLVVWLSTAVDMTYTELDDGPCCTSCDIEGGFEKYYSIDKAHGYCGECCMEPEKFPIYKIFEPGLTKANDSSPCADFHYHRYTKTETHGFGKIKMTLDLYAPDPELRVGM
mmetsp:Transcript_39405/g.76576  ORF Transcript_39405/g.76576 Transcript_39405/m.76576 type:complete len:117 (+) Transcript_39405:42-392(+)